MPAIPFSRRQWLGVSALGCGCALASSGGFAAGAAAAPIPPGYTPPESVTDLSKAPGLRSKLLKGGKVRRAVMRSSLARETRSCPA
jgi:hypothetical protein